LNTFSFHVALGTRDVSDVPQTVPRRFWFTLIVADCIQVLGKPNRDWAAIELNNSKQKTNFFQIITFYGYFAQFWETGHRPIADFLGYITNVPAGHLQTRNSPLETLSIRNKSLFPI
jgi:hypothetical protein